MAPEAFVLHPKPCPPPRVGGDPRVARKPLFVSIPLEEENNLITLLHLLLIHFEMPLNLNVSQHKTFYYAVGEVAGGTYFRQQKYKAAVFRSEIC